MSPNARVRARERRHLKKRQTVLARREMESRRNKQALGIVAILVVVIGGLVGLSMFLNKDKAGSNTQAGSAAKPVDGCVAAPKVPTDKRTATLPDKKTAAGKTFIATVTTNCGKIVLELDGTKAPQTVASFLGLAKSGYWVDSPCHRLTASATLHVLQCGDPTGTGGGSPGYSYGVENAPANSTYPVGTLAMARLEDPKTNGGQFFIVYKRSQIQVPTGYSIFGKVTSGMSIVDKVAAAGVNGSAPVQPISILKVDVTEKKA